MHRKLKYYLMLGAPIMVGGVLLGGGNAHAANTFDPSISLEKISEDSTLSNLQPTSKDAAYGQYKATYSLTASNIKDYAVYASTPDDNLVGKKNSNNKVPSMGSAQARDVEALNTNTWGFRASFDSEPTTYYTGVPVLAPESQRDKDALSSTAKYIGGDNVSYNTPVSRNIYLDVATKIDGSIPADNYEGTIILSAVATPAGRTIFDINYMQEMDPDICHDTITPTSTATIPALDGSDSYRVAITNKSGRKALVYDANNRTEVSGEPRTTIAVETTLRDARDDKDYLVAKLADGNCWMIQNLALESNTDRPKTILGYNAVDGALIGYKLPVSKLAADTFVSPDTGFMYNGSYEPNTYNTQGFVEDQTNCDSASSTAGCQGANSGSYYSWKVATAASTDSTIKYDNAPASICPKGWKLPTGGDRVSDNPDSQTLYNAYGSDYNTFSEAWHSGASDPSASFAGYLYTGKLLNSGASTYWLSSTVLSDAAAFSLNQNITVFNAAGFNYRIYGDSVRCIAAMETPTPVTAKTMQEFSKTDCGNLTGETELIDSRDNKVYKVAKLEDGNCWMIQNLALEGGTMLTPETSDVTSNYPLPESSTTGFSDNSTAYVYNGTHIGKANSNKQIVEHAAYDTEGYANGVTTANSGICNQSSSAGCNGQNSGAYYSWVAAKAGKANADESICPAGWKLPTGGAASQFSNLSSKYGSYDAFSTVWHVGESKTYPLPLPAALVVAT